MPTTVQSQPRRGSRDQLKHSIGTTWYRNPFVSTNENEGIESVFVWKDVNHRLSYKDIIHKVDHAIAGNSKISCNNANEVDSLGLLMKHTA